MAMVDISKQDIPKLTPTRCESNGIGLFHFEAGLESSDFLEQKLFSATGHAGTCIII
jgi:hypothetical protein